MRIAVQHASNSFFREAVPVSFINLDAFALFASTFLHLLFPSSPQLLSRKTRRETSKMIERSLFSRCEYTVEKWPPIYFLKVYDTERTWLPIGTNGWHSLSPSFWFSSNASFISSPFAYVSDWLLGRPLTTFFSSCSFSCDNGGVRGRGAVAQGYSLNICLY